MKKGKEINTVSDWWLPASLLKNPDTFPDGFCAHAEHWYLALLILLSSSEELRQKGVRDLQRRATATRLDLRTGVSVSGIQKLHAKSQGKQYYLGFESFLILSGFLAGTIAAIDRKRTVLGSKYELSTVRPLHPHNQILKLVENDQSVFTAQNQHMLDLLGETQEAIVQYGYIPALLYYLRKTGLKYSERNILSNQKKFEQYIS